MRRNLHITAALALAAAVPAVQATELETTVVTATRSEQNFSDTLASISIFERKDIERLQAVDLVDLLSRSAGISFVRNGGRGSSTTLLMRGNQGDHSLFLIDGVRIGSATLGSASLSSIDLNAVERIEIIRGPKSALWGADAIGGVVNIITRKGGQGADLALSSSYGSNTTTESSVHASYGNDDFSLSVSANAFNTEGIDNTSDTSGVNGDDDAYRNNSVGINYRQKLSEVLDLGISYNRYEGESEYDSGCTDSTSFAAVDCLIYSENVVDSLSAKVAWHSGDIYSGSLQIGRSNDESNNLADNVDLSGTFSGGAFNTQKTELNWLNVMRYSDQQTLTLGVDYQKDSVESDTVYDVDTRDNTGLFAQLDSNFGMVDTLLSARHDENEQFGGHTTFGAQLSVQLSDNVRVIASYGEGFKAPTFNDLYFPNFGDPSFEPEESTNLELALKGSFENVQFYVAAYNNDIENLIQYNSATFMTDQTAEAEITGFEFEISTEVAGLDLALSGSIMDPENKATGFDLRRRARNSYSLDIDKQFAAVSLGLSLRGESERFDDAFNTVDLDGYSLVDFRAAWSINDDWKIEARIDNLNDKQYSTAVDFSLGEYRSLGREAFVTIVYTPTAKR